eukprot:761471-Hanusia_phi.AAC.4
MFFARSKVCSGRLNNHLLQRRQFWHCEEMITVMHAARTVLYGLADDTRATGGTMERAEGVEEGGKEQGRSRGGGERSADVVRARVSCVKAFKLFYYQSNQSILTRATQDST